MQSKGSSPLPQSTDDAETCLVFNDQDCLIGERAALALVEKAEQFAAGL